MFEERFAAKNPYFMLPRGTTRYLRRSAEGLLVWPSLSWRWGACCRR